MIRRDVLGVLLALLCTFSMQRAVAADVVFDPWNKVENAMTATKMAEMVGLSAKQLYELKKTVDLSIQILTQATWIYDAVTGEWSVNDAVRSWLAGRIDLLIAENVPAQYQELVHAAVNNRIREYFRGHRARYPVLRRPQIDPWNPGSRAGMFYEDAQAAYDASHAIAEQTYDNSANTLRNLQALQSQLPQADVNSSVNVLSQIAIENGVTMADWIRANAAHEKARAYALSREIEAKRQWMEFMGVTDPYQQFGYLPNQQ